MTISELKKYIFENNKIEYVLEQLGCHNIKYNSKNDYYSAAQPDGNNIAGANIRNNEYLDYWSYTRGVSFEDKQDLISLVEYVNKCSFVEAVKYLHKILGLDYKPGKREKKKEKKFDPLAIFKKAVSRKKRVNVADIDVLDECVLDEYIPLLHISWLRDGIMPWSRKKFGLAYSYKNKRVIIPHRFWLTGELIGMNMRTTVENYEELGIRKYYLTEGMNKSINLYGLWENYDTIKETGYVVVYEAERSVLKRDSLNDPTGVCLSGHTLSDEQRSILIGLDVEIVVAMDADVSEVEVWSLCEKFFRIRNVSYIYDKWGLLNSKDSPADASNKKFNFLFKYRTQYTEEHHKKYIKSFEK